MEIEKLEKLSCLKIKENYRQKVAISLDGIMSMLAEVEQIEIPLVDAPEAPLTVFRSACADSAPDTSSLHLEEGLFLAPKVIKKDIS